MPSAHDVQKLFLQAVLSRGVLSEKLARVLRQRCVNVVNEADESLDVPSSDSDASWEAFIAHVNRTLDPLDLSFKFAFDETTGAKMCILANMKSDEVAQLATEYNVGEIAYFKAVVEQIMLAPRDAFSVSSFSALREVGQVKPAITKTQGEIILTSFVTNGWLARSKRGRYSLSLRSVQELAPYLKDNYPDQILECTICHEMITKGFACHGPKCETRTHYHCFKNLRARKSECPTCKAEWPRDPPADKPAPLIPIGEDAAREGDEHKRRTRRGEAGSDEDSDEADDDAMDEDKEDEEEEPKSQRARGKGKGKSTQKSRKKAAADMDEDGDEEVEVDEEDYDAVKDEDEEKVTKPTRRSTRKQ